MSDELKPGAFFDLRGIIVDDVGNFYTNDSSVVQVLVVETSYVLVEYITQFAADGYRLRRWIARALFHARGDDHFAVAAHPFKASVVVVYMAYERDAVRRLQTTGDRKDLDRYIVSIERALADAQAQRAAGAP